jgi:hypothetical protein
MLCQGVTCHRDRPPQLDQGMVTGVEMEGITSVQPESAAARWAGYYPHVVHMTGV